MRLTPVHGGLVDRDPHAVRLHPWTGAAAGKMKKSLNGAMTPDQFRAWRKSLGLKQKEAAELLGLKKRMIQYYEKGERDGKAVEIPKTVRLACYALSLGVADFDGARPRPAHDEEKTRTRLSH